MRKATPLGIGTKGDGMMWVAPVLDIANNDDEEQEKSKNLRPWLRTNYIH